MAVAVRRRLPRPRFATVTYSTTANAANTFGIASVALSNDAVLNVASGAVAATTATAAHAQFIFVQTTGELWFDADGSGGGSAVEIAMIDPATTAATVLGIAGTALESGDFMLVNA